nr:hypothetical transcript [Hymenolepis microstoma]
MPCVLAGTGLATHQRISPPFCIGMKFIFQSQILSPSTPTPSLLPPCPNEFFRSVNLLYRWQKEAVEAGEARLLIGEIEERMKTRGLNQFVQLDESRFE